MLFRSLDHETRNDAMKNYVGIQRPLAGSSASGVDPLALAGGEADKVVDSFRRVVAIKADDDIPVVSVQSGCVSM